MYFVKPIKKRFFYILFRNDIFSCTLDGRIEFLQISIFPFLPLILERFLLYLKNISLADKCKRRF